MSDDFDGDGALDVGTAVQTVDFDGDVVIGVWLGKGDGTFAFLSDVALDHDASTQLPRSCLVLQDLDGDGALDLVAVDGEVVVARGHGDGTFAPVTRFLVGQAPDTVSLGDLNGDAFVDIVATSRA